MMLEGKKGLIMGVANDRSIAASIASTLSKNGAKLCFSYQNENLLKRVERVAKLCKSDFLIECNVEKEDAVKQLIDQVEKKWSNIDFMIHSLAFAQKSELEGKLIEGSLDNFLQSMNISCYSLIEVTKQAHRILSPGASITTMTYYGAEKAMPNYNLMGIAKAALEASVRYLAVDLGEKNIRINAISAGPIKTLAASAIKEFNRFLQVSGEGTPLKRNITQEDVANTALFLTSNLSKSITGEIIHVDSGYHAIGMPLNML